MSRSIPLISVVIPCYNEEDSIPLLLPTLQEKLSHLSAESKIDSNSKVYLVDDGSEDKTWELINSATENNKNIVGVKLTRNFGHQHALYAGLMSAAGDVTISMDADFQDDINVIDQMIDEYAKGSEIVYGVRSDRSADTYFKRKTATIHYRFLQVLGIKTIPNHADFRLMSKQAITLLSRYKEENIYLRGVVPLLGLASSQVEYVRNSRIAGESKYNFKNMFSLSIKGITSFSIAPLRFIAFMGFLVFLVSILMAGWAFKAALGGDTAIAGWASTVIPIYFFGGLQLLALGVVGEYIGKTYIEVKNRPMYLIETVSEHDLG